jgi:hypothetical protein
LKQGSQLVQQLKACPVFGKICPIQSSCKATGVIGGRIVWENLTPHTPENVAHHLLCRTVMSTSFDSIYKKMASSLESGGAGHVHEAKSDPNRHISPAVAHELNNIFTVIQGYTERLLIKHGENPALETHLKLISEASRRAASIVRSAVPQEADLPIRPQQNPPSATA